MQFGREQGALKGELEDYLVKDDVIASSAQTMEDTLRYLDTRYGGIRCLSTTLILHCSGDFESSYCLGFRIRACDVKFHQPCIQQVDG